MYRLQYQVDIVVSSNHASPLIPDIQPPALKLSHHFEHLFESELFSDITFNVRGTEFRSHKLILVSRSPVFASILQHGIKERLLDYLEVHDVEPDVFGEMLRVIYTDRVQNLDKYASEMLAVANQYKLDLLKFQSEQFLAQSLTFVNCVSLLQLADLHSADQLKRICISYMESRVPDLVQTHDWREIKRNRPHLVCEVIEFRLSKNTSSFLLKNPAE